jgi:hypothetical protein
MFSNIPRKIFLKDRSEELRRSVQVLTIAFAGIVCFCFLFQVTILVLHSYSVNLPLFLAERLDQLTDKIFRVVR